MITKAAPTEILSKIVAAAKLIQSDSVQPHRR